VPSHVWSLRVGRAVLRMRGQKRRHCHGKRR